MAQRRMFSIKIIDSARFLKMPPSTRLLYFDLCMRADDDGVVEGFNVLRMTGATEDDLRVLVTKGFVKVLNEDLVTYITDWQEHNKIRADRKVNSIHKDLLLKALPDAKLLEPRQRADRKTGTSQGQPMDGIGKDRIGKDSIGKDSIGKDSIVQQQDIDKNNSSSCCGCNDVKAEIIKYMLDRGFTYPSPIQIDKIIADIEIYNIEEVKKSIDIADNNGKHTYSYVKGILERRKADGGPQGSYKKKPYIKQTAFNNFEPRKQSDRYNYLQEQCLLGQATEEEKEEFRKLRGDD